MARQVINIGSSANDGTGDPLRTAFDKINDNFVELYGGDNDINTLDANLNTNNFAITTGVTNGDITITPNGTGAINLGAMKFVGTTISSDDSTQITIAENIQTTGTINVTGAATLGTSLTLATGATVTGIDNGTLATGSATLLATQGAIKTYIDAQNIAQAITFVGDDSTGTAVNSGETFQITGGTGLTSVVSGDAMTLAIDSTVTTLTGSQTLTNKVLTSPTISSPTITGVTTTTSLTTNDITSNGSNANITINPQGTGTIELGANTNITGTASVSSTLTTADITQTGNTTTTGNNTIAGVLTATSVTTNDITTNGSNADLTLDPQGTGAVVIGANITHTGTQTTTGQMNVDNLRLDGNTISATTGGITIDAATNQNITFNKKIISSAADISLLQATTVRADTLQNDTSDGDISISTQGTGVVDFNTATQTTVGAVGAATHLPLDSANEIRPLGYLKIKVAGVDAVIPYFNAS
jgi:fibronectin-binding autotransporter adhesin